LGINPLLTISALSERIVELLIQDGTVNKKPREGVLPPAIDISPAVGMEFTEEMKGFLTESIKDATMPQDYAQAETRGKGEGKELGFKLTIYIDDVDGFVTEPQHEARAEGYVAMGPSRYSVERGRFNLFIKDPQTHTKRMLYSLQFRGDDDQPYLLEGYKEIHDDPDVNVREIWNDTTTLFTTVYRGKTRRDPVVGQGIIRVHLQDFLKQLTTFDVRNAPNAKVKARALTHFMSFFFGELWETYVKNLVSGL
jgi:cholesterol oxidase